MNDSKINNLLSVLYRMSQTKDKIKLVEWGMCLVKGELESLNKEYKYMTKDEVIVHLHDERTLIYPCNFESFEIVDCVIISSDKKRYRKFKVPYSFFNSEHFREYLDQRFPDQNI